MIPPAPDPWVPLVEQDPPALDSEAAALRVELAAAHRRIGDLARTQQASEEEGEQIRRRLVREREQSLELERGRAVLPVLQAIDELDRCLKSADDSSLATGVRLIRNNLAKSVKDSGVDRIALEGTAFDPRLAEAVGTVSVRSPADNEKVIEVIRGGYSIHGKVVRPGHVLVGRYAGLRG